MIARLCWDFLGTWSPSSSPPYPFGERGVQGYRVSEISIALLPLSARYCSSPSACAIKAYSSHSSHNDQCIPGGPFRFPQISCINLKHDRLLRLHNLMHGQGNLLISLQHSSYPCYFVCQSFFSQAVSMFAQWYGNVFAPHTTPYFPWQSGW